MSSVNKVILLGRLGKDPVKVGYGDDRTLVDFSLATSSSWLDKSTNQWQENVQWHKCVCYDANLVEYADKVHKGDMVYIEGSLQTKTINSGDSLNGKQLQQTQVVVKQMRLIKSKSDLSTGNHESTDSINDDINDIPF